jgi:group I intron endonuclease
VYLYLIRNLVNGKGYVGITKRPLRKRLLDHYAAARGGKETAIARAITKYGQDAFTVTLLGEAPTWEELLAMEREAIQTYNTFHLTGHGYNLTLGGDGTTGWKHTEASKARMGLANKGRVLSAEHRAAVSQAHRGIPKSLEQRQKIGEAQRGEKNHRYGKPLSEDHKAKLLAANLGRTSPMAGKKHSEATRRKIAAAGMGRRRSEESIRQGADKYRGSHHSEATKALLAEKARAQFARQGNPMQGRMHSEETRRKIAEKAKGRTPWNKGRPGTPLSEETRHKLSAQRRGQTAWNKGLPHTAETRAKMSAAHRRRPAPQARPVEVDGIVYASITDAAQRSGLTRMQVRYRLQTGKARYVTKDEE